MLRKFKRTRSTPETATRKIYLVASRNRNFNHRHLTLIGCSGTDGQFIDLLFRLNSDKDVSWPQTIARQRQAETGARLAFFSAAAALDREIADADWRSVRVRTAIDDFGRERKRRHM